MTSNVSAENVNTSSWHVGITPVFPSSLLLSDNAAIESLLADIPFLAVGLLAFAVLTFLLFFKKFTVKSTPLFLSAILAFIAVVLDVDQLLVQNPPSNGNTSKSNDGLIVPLSSVLPLLVTREVLLGMAIGMRFLFFWVHLHSISTHIGTRPYRKDTALTRTTSNIGELNFLKLHSPSPDPSQMSSNGLTSGRIRGFTVSSPSIFVFALKYVFLVMITSIPILQLLWRLIKKFNRHGELYVANSIIEIVASIIFIMTLLMAVLVDIVETGNFFSLSWRKVGKWNRLRGFMPVLFSAFVELGSSIGSLLCFGFSESSLGRLLQALELYILILYILISTFYKTRAQSQISEKSLDIEEGNKDQDTNLMEKLPASGQEFDTPVDTSKSFLPTSTSRLPRRVSKYRSAGSWALSVRTDRDNDTDNNSGMLSVPGSSILSPSRGSKQRLSLWPSVKRQSERSLKSLSGLLGGSGGRIRSVSWEILNDPMQTSNSKKGSNGANTAGILPVSNQAPSDSETENNLQAQSRYRLPFFKLGAPPLAGRLERLATELDSAFSVPGAKGQPTSNTIPTSSVDRTSESTVLPEFQPQVLSGPDEFRLTPVVAAAPDLHPSSYYDADPNPDSYDKSIRSFMSGLTTETELFLRQQQAGLEQSVAELQLLEGGTGLDDGRYREGSMTSDFSLSEFPGLPTSLNHPSNTYQNEQLAAGNLSPGDRTPLSFQPPWAIRTSADSSVLGLSEGTLTLGLGSDSGAFIRGEPSTRHLDVTSFIAAGEEGTDSFRPRFHPAPPSLSGTEDAEGVDTPPPTIVRFATRVHVPPVTSVSAAVSRSLSGSRSGVASDAVDGTLSQPVTTTQAQTPSGAARSTSINRPLRKKIGMGLPSSVKPIANPSLAQVASESNLDGKF